MSRGRFVARSAEDQTFFSPSGTTSTSHTPEAYAVTVTLPSIIDAQGVYFCGASSRDLTSTVPVTILAANS